jgi:NADPH-dependent glutamate synthase beta subunit-like oxidoreductase
MGIVIGAKSAVPRETLENIGKATSRRIQSNAHGICPVDMTRAQLEVAYAQCCGKCVPCRVGVGVMLDLLDDIIDGKAHLEDLGKLEHLANDIAISADCAIGIGAAQQVLIGLSGFREDFNKHAASGECAMWAQQGVPCQESCPAHVDIPGYIALTAEGRYDDAVELIRKDNPFPSACGYICEHPCELTCRRGMVDDAINIRGIKRFAVDHASRSRRTYDVKPTGKCIAVVGAGPSGLTAAFYLARMGHAVTVFESREKPGGMLRYGIPNYRFPRAILDAEVESILSLGIDLKCNVKVGEDISVEDLREGYDALYLAIGAHGDKKVNFPGEDAEGVIPAVRMLRAIGSGNPPDFSGKKVCVIGGGNVAMDAARSATRLGADRVTIVYRRRITDMTALPAEVTGAIADNCEFAELMSPGYVELDDDGRVAALWAQPQVIGEVKRGRPAPAKADRPAERFECQVIIVAIGQEVQSEAFEAAGIPTDRKTFSVDETLASTEAQGVFAGGDCMAGPKTVIRAIADGKRAARSIDTYLGFHHRIVCDVDLPAPRLADRRPAGRAEMEERPTYERCSDFNLVEFGLEEQEMQLETARCLGCDHFGCGVLKKEGRLSW